ncbi:hypothetical protein CHUAL_014088 [Chamberlinius hualienensis]
MNDRITVTFICMLISVLGHLECEVTRSRRHVQYGDVFVKPGSNVFLSCDITNVTGLIRWLRNEKELRYDQEGSDRFHLGINQTSLRHFLRIEGVLMEDDGVWHCQDVRDHQSWTWTSRPMRIIVLVAPSPPYLTFEDKRLPEDATFTIKEKNSVQFECIVDSANPAPEKIDWMLDNVTVSSWSRTVVLFSEEKRLYNSKSILTFEVMRTHHRKSLACHVHHLATDGSVVSRIVFNILYSPSFVISRVPDYGFPIHEGIEVSLRCEVNANPLSRPQWIKDNGPPPIPQTDDGYLNFTKIQRDHAGWYRCSTNHQFGNFASFAYFLNVRYGAEIVEQPPPKVQAGVGGSVMLECNADGKPPPSYCWARVKEGGRLESLGLEQNLVLDRVLYSDAGVYKCIARNQIGWEEKRADSHNVEVVVTGRPVVDAVNRSLMAVVGHSTSFFVHYCAYPEPRRTQWIVRNRVLNPGDVVDRFVAHAITPLNASNCYQTSLDIRDIQSEDVGEYLFLVKNDIGIDDATVLLNISHASFSVSLGVTVHNVERVWLIIVVAVLMIALKSTRHLMEGS